MVIFSLLSILRLPIFHLEITDNSFLIAGDNVFCLFTTPSAGRKKKILLNSLSDGLCIILFCPLVLMIVAPLNSHPGQIVFLFRSQELSLLFEVASFSENVDGCIASACSFLRYLCLCFPEKSFGSTVPVKTGYMMLW